MHWLEHVIYFSRALWVFLFPGAFHPVHLLFTILRATIGPAPGHHGFEDAYGSRFHWLHHHHVECNYGTRGTLDILFGTYRE